VANDITITIDGIQIKTVAGKRVLEAALDNGIYIPNLCSLRDIKQPTGACRLCQVMVEGKERSRAACQTPVAEGMVVHSNTPEVNAIRRKILAITLATHPHTCLGCHRLLHCGPGEICLRFSDAGADKCVLCGKNGRCDIQLAVDFIGLDEDIFPYRFKELETVSYTHLTLPTIYSV